MKEIMLEETVQPESYLVSEFLRAGVMEAAVPIARLCVDTIGLSTADIRMLGGNDKEIAQALSKVEVVDPHYEQSTSNLQQPTDEQIGDAALITVAKAEAVKSEHPRLKARLNKFEDTILDKVGRFLARTGGKKAIAAVSGLALLATSCGSIVTTGSPATLTPTERPAITETSYPTTCPLPSMPSELLNKQDDLAEPITVQGGAFKDTNGDQWKMGDEDFDLTGGSGIFLGWVNKDSVPGAKKESCYGRVANPNGLGITEFNKISGSEK